ncbi:MAG: 30S ribosomal protein S6 [Chloroflexi bacterium RBG_16_50_9]|nr:MAG: 30S ribosomal protein S6 [Chloroflexi bacterium RBG_16_50_9]
MAVRKKQEVKAESKRSQDYELAFIVSPEVSEESLEAIINSVSQFITNREGNVSDVEKWGKKKLAYPLKHYLEGNYVLTRFKLSPAQCKELMTNLRISENILRHLLIKIGV